MPGLVRGITEGHRACGVGGVGVPGAWFCRSREPSLTQLAKASCSLAGAFPGVSTKPTHDHRKTGRRPPATYIWRLKGVPATSKRSISKSTPMVAL